MLGKKVTVEIRDLTIFSFVILLCLSVYAATVYSVLGNVSSLLLQLGLYESADYVGVVGVSVVVISIVLMVLYYFVVGTILKRLNKANKWKEKNVDNNITS